MALLNTEYSNLKKDFEISDLAKKISYLHHPESGLCNVNKNQEKQHYSMFGGKGIVDQQTANDNIKNESADCLQ